MHELRSMAAVVVPTPALWQVAVKTRVLGSTPRLMQVPEKSVGDPTARPAIREAMAPGTAVRVQRAKTTTERRPFILRLEEAGFWSKF
jgi:hypothetical protein